MNGDRAGWTGPGGFSGSKIAIISSGALLVYLRDTIETIPFPGYWDLPGGGREGDESPETCALRELEEEFSLTLPESALCWRRAYPPVRTANLPSWFFVANVPRADLSDIRFGDEGQEWALWPLETFLNHDRAVPHLQHRLRDYLADQDGPA
ncbi:MAG: NUDIX hydrolase [Pseudomonadota bacterium]